MLNPLYERIVETLTDTLTTAELVDVWNEYCNNNNYYDDRIENMGFLDEDLDNLNATQIIRLVSGKDFDVHDDWYKHTIYGLQSFSDPADEIDIDDLADYIERNDNDLGSSDIRDTLDETDDDDNDDDKE